MTFNTSSVEVPQSECRKCERSSTISVHSGASSFYSYTSTFGVQSRCSSRYETPRSQRSVAGSIRSAFPSAALQQLITELPAGFEYHSAEEYRTGLVNPWPMDDSFEDDNDANEYAEYAQAQLNAWKQQLENMHHPIHAAASGSQVNRKLDNSACSVREGALMGQGEEQVPNTPQPDYRGICIQGRLGVVGPATTSICTSQSSFKQGINDTYLVPAKIRDRINKSGIMGKLYCWSLKFQKGKFTDEEWREIRELLRLKEQLTRKTIGNGSLKRRKGNKNTARMTLDQ